MCWLIANTSLVYITLRTFHPEIKALNLLSALSRPIIDGISPFLKLWALHTDCNFTAQAFRKPFISSLCSFSCWVLNSLAACEKVLMSSALIWENLFSSSRLICFAALKLSLISLYSFLCANPFQWLWILIAHYCFATLCCSFFTAFSLAALANYCCFYICETCF